MQRGATIVHEQGGTKLAVKIQTPTATMTRKRGLGRTNHDKPSSLSLQRPNDTIRARNGGGDDDDDDAAKDPSQPSKRSEQVFINVEGRQFQGNDIVGNQICRDALRLV